MRHPLTTGSAQARLLGACAVTTLTLLLVPSHSLAQQREVIDDEMRQLAGEAASVETAAQLVVDMPAAAESALGDEASSLLAELRALPTSAVVRVVRLDMAALDSDSVVVSAGDAPLMFNQVSREDGGAGAEIWIGELAQASGQAVLERPCPRRARDREWRRHRSRRRMETHSDTPR